MKNTDLHIHSIYSDGDLSPKEIIHKAKRNGVKNLAVTDHNSVKGVEEAIREGKKVGINVIPGIEVTAEGGEVLGYFINYKSKKLKQEEEKIQGRSIRRIKKMILKLNKKGIAINFSDLIERYKPNRNFTKVHVVKFMSKQKGADYRELLKKYASKGTDTYVSYKRLSITEAIKLIKKYNGIPVLAHPWCEPTSKNLLEEKNLRKLIKLGLKGIEIDQGDRDERRDKKFVEKIRHLGKKYNLIITSGSDFHGDYLINICKNHELGKNNCDEKVVEQLRKLAKSNLY